MRLAIIDEEGEVHEVVDDLQDYDLRESIARIDICEEIQQIMNSLKPKTRRPNANRTKARQ
jgi:hypothetical protein